MTDWQMWTKEINCFHVTLFYLLKKVLMITTEFKEQIFLMGKGTIT